LNINELITKCDSTMKTEFQRKVLNKKLKAKHPKGRGPRTMG
jgi:hypothetical protein